MPPELPGLTPNAMRLLWALVERWDGEPIRAMSVRVISEKAIRRACGRLEFYGLVRLDRRGRGRSSANEPARGVWVEPTFLGRRMVERAAEQPMSAAKAAK
jgi:hypothetical protein